MTIYELPLYSDNTARWTSKIDLDKKRYMLYFSWNSMCELWEFSIYDNNDNLLIGGIRLVRGIDLFDEYRNYIKELPTGILQLIPKNDNVIEITRNNLNSDYSLIYFEKDEEKSDNDLKRSSKDNISIRSRNLNQDYIFVYDE